MYKSRPVPSPHTDTCKSVSERTGSPKAQDHSQMEIRSHKVGKSQAWQALNRKRNKKKAAPVKPETFAGESTCWRSGRDRVWFYKKFGDCGDAQWRLTIRPTRVTRKTRILERFGQVEFAEKIGASTRTIPPWRPAPQTRTQQLSKTARVPITQSAFSVWRNKKRFRFQPSLLFLPVSFIFVAASLSRQSIHITSSSWWWRHGKRFNANCRQFPQLVKTVEEEEKKKHDTNSGRQPTGVASLAKPAKNNL